MGVLLPEKLARQGAGGEGCKARTGGVAFEAHGFLPPPSGGGQEGAAPDKERSRGLREAPLLASPRSGWRKNPGSETYPVRL